MNEELSERATKGIEQLKQQIAGTEPPSAGGNDVETDGSKMNWVDYDLDKNYFHFYPRATLELLEQGWKWTAPYIEFNNQNVRFDKGFLSEYLERELNGPNGWSLVSVVYNGAGQSNVVLRRVNKLVLPDPKKIGMGEIEPPSATQLDAFDEKAKDWEAKGIEE